MFLCWFVCFIVYSEIGKYLRFFYVIRKGGLFSILFRRFIFKRLYYIFLKRCKLLYNRREGRYLCVSVILFFFKIKLLL